MISRQQADVQPWRKGGRSFTSAGRHGKPSSLRDTINAHLEELRFRNGVLMLVAAAAVLAVVVGGVLTTLREDSDPRRPAGRNAGPPPGPSSSSSPSSGPSASADPARDVPTPPMASNRSKLPPVPVSPPTSPAPSSDVRRTERPGWPTGMPRFPNRRHRHWPPGSWPYDQSPPWGDRR